jgi:sulfite reductase (NADPH) hemoprotein beta-component
MAATEDRETLGRARLSFADQADIDEFVTVLGRFERGEITPEEWRGFRLVRGTYGQRQTTDSQMLRVKIPQGVLEGPQLEALADVADRYSRGFGHITTRQNVQFHFMKLHDVEPAMRLIAGAGITTREACGNSVRNITACPYSGVAADEPFDVTPYAEGLTRYLLRHPLSASLPRKFKIAFEGCSHDHILTSINDIGFTARVRAIDGRQANGFRITVAGGTSTMVRAGHLLFDFVPAGEILNVAEAVIRVFHRLGDYKHKTRNRLKFLVKSLGWDGFKAEFDKEYDAFRAGGGATLTFDPDQPAVEDAPPPSGLTAPSPRAIAERVTALGTHGPGLHPPVEPQIAVDAEAFRQWALTNVRPQRQPGYRIVIVSTLLGDMTSTQMRVAADLAAVYGDGSVRITHDQNLVFRWVRSDDVAALHRSLAAAGLARAGANTLADVTSCPGAESCKLAVTQSRGLGRLLSEHLQRSPDVVSGVPGLDIKISGCPNVCGQHHIAGIGFQGSLRKVGGRPAPHYMVMVGGGAADDVTTFGRLAATVPAHRCDTVVDRLVQLYRERRVDGESAIGFFRRVEVGVVKAALADLEKLSPDTASESDFTDLGESTAFQPDVQDGECSA